MGLNGDGEVLFVVYDYLGLRGLLDFVALGLADVDGVCLVDFVY